MKKQEISFCDMFCGNQIKTLEEGKDDFIIFRADGAVSYQLAASADDGIMQVTHVFRGNDLLPSTFLSNLSFEKAWLSNSLIRTFTSAGR